MTEETPTEKAPREETDKEAIVKIIFNYLDTLNPTIPESVRRIHE